MTLSRLPDGSVRFAQMDEWHLQTLKHIPSLANPGDEDGPLRRLYPAPFAAGEATPEQQDDWAELVQPDLEELFSGSLAHIAADLKQAELEPAGPPPSPDPDDLPGESAGESGAGSPDEPPKKRSRRKVGRPPVRPAAAPQAQWKLTVPPEHAEDWYRAMNQARLMLSERYEAHRADNAHVAEMFVAGKLEILVQYEFLTSLCSWWVDAVLRKQS